jgi:hypothetical protein
MPFKKSEDDFPSEKDDILGEDAADELNLDSLLDEDETPSPKKKPASPRSGSDPYSQEKGPYSKDGAPKGGASKESAADQGVIDHGELDLLADDEPLEISDADLVEADAPSGDEQDSSYDSKHVGSSNNGSSLGEDEAESGAGDEMSSMDLLSDDDAISGSAPSGKSSGTGSEEETVPLPAPSHRGEEGSFEKGPEKGPEKGSAKKEKKAGKQKLGKGLKKLEKKARKGKVEESAGAGSEEGAPEEATAPKSAKASKEAARPAAMASRPKTRGALTFICSECYEEFLLPPNFSKEMVSCPECLHVGKRPEEDFLRTVSLHKSNEQRSFLAALVAGAVVALLLLFLLWLKLPGGKPSDAPSAALVYGLLGASALGVALFVWLIVRFESNRWEVYF